MPDLGSIGNASVEPLVGSTIAQLPTAGASGSASAEPYFGTTLILPTVENTGQAFLEPLPQSAYSTLSEVYNTGIPIIEPLPYTLVPGFVPIWNSGTSTVTGTVQNGSSAPLARRVIAFERTTNLPIAVITSSSVTGGFTLNMDYTGVYVVALPNIGDGVNAEIYDNITPIQP